MSISINTDIAAIRTIGVLEDKTKLVSDATESLSTGLRINRASDDAANLSLSTNLNARKSGLHVANNNIQTGLTKIQTFDGYMEGITNNIHRLKELAVQAANGVYSANERDLINKEAQQIVEELVVSETLSNEEMVSDTMSIHTGDQSDSFLDITGLNLDFTTGMSVTLSTANASRATIQELETALNYINDKRSSIGSNMNMLEAKLDINDTRKYELTDTVSKIKDADMGYEASKRIQNQILQQSSVALMQQSNQMRANNILSLI